MTPAIVPGTIAISVHCGHWEYGRYASSKKAPLAEGDDPGYHEKWWNAAWAHPNWIIPNKPDPINGQMAIMDAVAQVVKSGQTA